MSVEDRPKLLIVEDDLGLQKQLKWCLDEYEVLPATNRAEAIAQLRRFEPGVVLQDLGLPPDADGVSEGMQALTEILALAPQTKVIVVTGKSERQNALAAVASGAYDFYQKPVDEAVLKLVVARAFRIHALEMENRALLEASGSTPFAGFVATDEATLKVCRMVEKVAPADVSVLVLGESGTGKELLARALHSRSSRSKNRFVAINCAAIPEQLLESELFGHERGAFTGAVKQTVGKIELADGGTLFLDEIGDMPLSLQAKLLRFLQDRVIERVGGRQEIPVNVRVVCATNKNLQSLIAQQSFREDLFFRISEVTVNVPPLRDREGGPTVVAHAMLQKHAASLPKAKRGFTPEALAALEAYAWPGNVRELENKVKTALIMAEGPLITPEDLGLATAIAGESVFNLKQVRSRAERHAIASALAVADGNITRTAELLGITRPTLYDLLDRYGMRGVDSGASS
jgi:two-component system NtrC family response regulator